MKYRVSAGLAGLVLLLAVGSASAHVGSPDIFYEGDAGPYHVLVTIQPPDVVPGTAQVSVRIERGEASTVEIQPIYYNSGKDGAPKADAAERSTADPSMFNGKLWLMEHGSSSVNIDIDGPAGKGSVVVPAPAVATARRVMPRGLGLLLAGLGLFLFAGAVSLIGACVRDGVVAPSAQVDSRRKKRARIVMAATAVLFVAAAYFGDRWWGISDSHYLRHMYTPTSVNAKVLDYGQERVLSLSPGVNVRMDGNARFVDLAGRDLLPDHGKLMHAFLIQDGGAGAFAHIHPDQISPGSFEAVIPASLPDGHYRLFADIVHVNGLAETLTASVDLNKNAADIDSPVSTISQGKGSAPVADPDDSWRVGATAAESQSQLEDGSLMTWQHRSTDFKAGRLESLDFKVTTSDGSPAALEPYMGMMSHAAVMRDDGSVFVHLHPMGTVSMASQEAFAARVSQPEGQATMASADQHMSAAQATDNAENKAASSNVAGNMGDMPDMPGMEMSESGGISEVSFPYAFPKAGHYTRWVQVKRQGRILTGVFEANVN
jgi:hypothetical protein